MSSANLAEDSLSPISIRRIAEDPRLQTPAFVFLQQSLLDNCHSLRRVADAVGAQALYSLKALTLPRMLPEMARILDGFSVSSLFEARLARMSAGPGAILHLTAPGIRPQEMGQLSGLCNLISLNSLSQLERYHGDPRCGGKLGIRVNPRLSFIADPRYDPCAPRSRLGVPIESLLSAASSDWEPLASVRGIHVHSNCESEDLGQIHETALKMAPVMRAFGSRIAWVNLGGGYYFPETGAPEALQRTVELYRTASPGLTVYLEPGTAIAQDAGILVATVLDVIARSDVSIAVLDTSVNHLPEVFDYRYKPDVQGATKEGSHEYALTGRSCLAGDIFGDYRFDHPLCVGDRVCFLDVGSYSLARATMFNGIALPEIHLARLDGSLESLATTSFERWSELCGGGAAAEGSIS